MNQSEKWDKPDPISVRTIGVSWFSEKEYLAKGGKHEESQS
jgi:hypothetical protein